MLDQSIIAGIGNIYSDEILFRAKITPSVPANILTKKDCDKLAEIIPECLKYFIEKIKFRRLITLKQKERITATRRFCRFMARRESFVPFAAKRSAVLLSAA